MTKKAVCTLKYTVQVVRVFNTREKKIKKRHLKIMVFSFEFFVFHSPTHKIHHMNLRLSYFLM